MQINTLNNLTKTDTNPNNHGGLAYTHNAEAKAYLDSCNAYKYVFKNHYKALETKLYELKKQSKNGFDFVCLIEEFFLITITGKNENTRLKKALDVSHIKRKVNKLAAQQAENANYIMRRVGNAQHYASLDLIKHRHKKEQNQKRFLKTHKITKDGKELFLEDIATTPHARASELFSRAKSLEELADAQGFTFAFFTVTTPAHMHINPSRGRNSWDGTSPKQASDWLSDNWAKTRAMIAKNDINYFGFWSKEPHKDGTPHMHGVIYAKTEDLDEIERCINYHFAHSKIAVDFKIGTSEAKPTSYITKYILKALGFDGNQTIEKLSDADFETDEALALRASTLAWGYRRFGFFGTDSKLGLWREARKMKPHGVFTLLAETAQANDWKAFLDVSEGFKLYYEDRFNAYDEAYKAQRGIVHLESGEMAIRESWEIVKLEEDEVLKREVTLSLNYPRQSKSKSEKQKSEELKPPE